MKRRLMRIATLTVWALALCCCVAGVSMGAKALWMNRPHAVNAAAEVARMDALEKYDSSVQRQAMRGGLSTRERWPKNVEYTWEFARLNDADGTNRVTKIAKEKGEELVKNVTFYSFSLTVKNKTKRKLSGLNLTYDASIAEGEYTVVADEVTVLPKMRYRGKTVEMPLNLVGEKVPFELDFLSGNPTFLWKNDSDEQEYLEPYLTFKERLDRELDDQGRVPYDDAMAQQISTWKNEGVDLDIPAGEKWKFEMIFMATPVYDVQLTSKISTKEGEVEGSYLIVPSKKKKETCHVESVFTNPDRQLREIAAQPALQGNVEMVPGSTKLNDKPVADFALEKSVNDEQRFKKVWLDLEAYGGEAKLEYDVKVKNDDRLASVAMNGSDVAGNTLVDTQVWCVTRDFLPLKDVILIWGMIITCIVAGILLLYYSIIDLRDLYR